MNRRGAVLISLMLAVSVNAGEVDIVKYRQSLMKAMGSYANALNAIGKGSVPFKNDVGTHAQAIRDIAHQLPALFPAGTGPDKAPTDALPTVWTKTAQFAAAAKKLETEASRLQQLAKTSNTKAIAAQVDAVKHACGACHDSFRMHDD
jgi:cytochrome c556